MKHGTELKLKFKDLQARLRASLWETKGILQALWDFTGDNAIRGDIGRFTDEQIAVGIEFPRERASELVTALRESGWLDPHAVHRLVIHDWSEHAEDWIRKRVERSRKGWAADDRPAENDNQRPPVAAIVGQCPPLSDDVDRVPMHVGTLRNRNGLAEAFSSSDTAETHAEVLGVGSGEGEVSERDLVESLRRRHPRLGDDLVLWFSALYERRFGGLPDAVELGRTLDELRKSHSIPTIRAHFRVFCECADADEFLTLKGFRTKFGRFSPNRPSHKTRGADGQQLTGSMASLRRVAERVAGGLP